MWVPDHGVAESLSWRIALMLCRRHDHLRIGWMDGPGGVDYDPMSIEGRGERGRFQILINRVGTIQVHTEDQDDDGLVLGWDEVVRRADPTGPPLLTVADLVTRIERAAGLRYSAPPSDPDELEARGPWPSPDAYTAAMLGVLTSTHVAMERPLRTSTVTVLSRADEEQFGTHWLFERIPGLVDDVRARFDGPDDERQVWVVHLESSRHADLVVDPSGPRAWVAGLDRPVDLLALGGRPDLPEADPAIAALRLLGPVADLERFTVAPERPAPWQLGDAADGDGPPPPLPDASPQGPGPGTELGPGIIEAAADGTGAYAILGGRIEVATGSADGIEEGAGNHIVRVRPVDGPDRILRGNRPPKPGPHDGTILFFVSDAPMLHRPLTDRDAPLVSRYDVGLDLEDLGLLVAAVEDLRPAAPHTDVERWRAFEEQREELEEFAALVAADGDVVYGLHYMLLDERRVTNPLFRDGAAWDSSLPPDDPRWVAEGRRVLREGLATSQHTDPNDPDDDPARDPFMLLEVSDYLPIHPTMANAFMQLFDRGGRVPASLARLAEGHADDPMRPSGTTGRPGEGMDGTDRPLTRIEAFHVLADIEAAFGGDSRG